MSRLDAQGYIVSLLRQGHSSDSVSEDLISIGWHSASARRLVEKCIKGEPARPTPSTLGPDLSRLPTTFDLDGQVAEVQIRLHRPQISVLSNFLSAEECTQLMELARPRMERSMVILGDGEIDEQGVSAYSRTSEQASFPPGDSELVDKILRRVANFANWSESCVESVQVVRYAVGADFAPHHDYFCPKVHAGMIAREGQRVGTVILYLNTPESGGVTAFPDIELEIYPQRGNALFFMYPIPEADSLTLHAGVPLGSGEKWIATFFFRDKIVERK